MNVSDSSFLSCSSSPTVITVTSTYRTDTRSSHSTTNLHIPPTITPTQWSRVFIQDFHFGLTPFPM